MKDGDGTHYNPKLVIIVAQKKHNTRFFKDVSGDSKGGKGYSERGEGKGKGKGGGKSSGKPGFEVQVDQGTVAASGIARPGHLNFFLVSQHSGLGTAVPCHYNVLHMDKRLHLTAHDVEIITYHLCHLYSRADKVVGYAPPAYLADHLCERGKEYVEAHFGTNGAPLLKELSDDQIKEDIEQKIAWLNGKWSSGGSKTVLNGRNYFC